MAMNFLLGGVCLLFSGWCVHSVVGKYNVWDERHAHATTAGEEYVVLRTAVIAFAIDTTAHHSQHASPSPVLHFLANIATHNTSFENRAKAPQ